MNTAARFILVRTEKASDLVSDAPAPLHRRRSHVVCRDQAFPRPDEWHCSSYIGHLGGGCVVAPAAATKGKVAGPITLFARRREGTKEICIGVDAPAQPTAFLTTCDKSFGEPHFGWLHPDGETLIVALRRDEWDTTQVDHDDLDVRTVRIADIAAAMEERKKRGRELNDQALALHKKGEHKEAAKLFAEAFEADNSYAQAAFNAACAFAKAGSVDDALRCLSSAIELDAKKFKAKAAKDADLDGLRSDEKFQKVLAP